MKYQILSIIFLLVWGGLVIAEDSEPKFNSIKRSDTDMQKAYDMASRTISSFVSKVQVGGNSNFMAKLKFRDPKLSEEMGSDQFLFLWLNGVAYHADEQLLSGVFFEVPESLKKWHQVGERLGFYPEDVFDWMVNDNGVVQGGFTIRVTRSRLNTEEEKTKYDEYIGIKSYEPLSE